MTVSAADILSIDVAKLMRMQMLHVHFLLFDLRAKEAFEQGHINGAFHVPSGDFIEALPRLLPKKDMPVVVYDQEGVGVVDLIVAAENSGYLNIVNLEGGYRAYLELSAKP